MEDPERKRRWAQAVHELRKGDHYFLVLWDIQPPSDHPTRDSFKLLGAGFLIALGFGMTVILAMKYNDLERFHTYLLVVVALGVLIATGLPRALYRLAVAWFDRRMTDND